MVQPKHLIAHIEGNVIRYIRGAKSDDEAMAAYRILKLCECLKKELGSVEEV